MSEIVRLNNTLWGYTPAPLVGHESEMVPLQQIQIDAASYEIAERVQALFVSRNIHFMSELANGFSVDGLKISLVQRDSYFDRILQFFPLLARYPNQNIARVEATCEKVASFAPFKVRECPVVAIDASFTDAYTILATEAFQTVEPYFVSEQKVQDAFRYSLGSDNVLRLKSSAEPYDEEENRRTVAAFRDMIIDEFGHDMLAYVNAAYGFSLDELFEKGLPLVPDHVFKTNIGMNNVELGHVQALLDTLIAKEYAALPKRVQRKVNDTLLAEIPNGPTSVKSLPPALFNQLVDLLVLNQEERERAFTGRKIEHLAIWGSNTMGDPDIANPSRDLFELMHIYEGLKKVDDWENYFELLCHVAVKKALYRKSITPNEWHVGFLLPAPQTQGGEARWYYNEAFFDDASGNINYVLLPACDGYKTADEKPLPFIKDYRSTASDFNAISSLESVAADLNPYGSPGSTDPNSSYAYEKSYFQERTIPLWVAKLLAEEPQEALAEYIRCLEAPGPTPPEKLALARAHIEAADRENIKTFLLDEARLHNELPENKIAQDIVSIGHSLGGGLAQFGIYYFGPRRRRIPLPGHNFISYAQRAPAINSYQDRLFMQFGRENKATLAALGQRWANYEYLEYGDPVPQFGNSHLGTTGYDENIDGAWLYNHFMVLKPQPSAQALEVTTLPTHARRIGLAKEGVDFTKTQITAEQLFRFDHSWWMQKDLLALFGYRILRSSKIAEFGREVVSLVARPFMIVLLKVYNYFYPPVGTRDKNGGFYMRYSQPQ